LCHAAKATTRYCAAPVAISPCNRLRSSPFRLERFK